MCLGWSLTFRSTLGTLCKLQTLAAANAFFSIRQLQLCNTHAPTISISIISESYYQQSLTSKGWFRGNSTIHEGSFKHFKSLCVSVDPKHSEVHWAHGANYTCLPPQMLHLTLPLCPLVFINICFLLQAHSICLCILLSFEIQKTQTLTTFHHLAASLAATLHLIASSDTSDLRPCTHYQCQINLKVLPPPNRKRPWKLPSKCVDNTQDWPCHSSTENAWALTSHAAWKNRMLRKLPAESGFFYAKQSRSALTNCDKPMQNLDQSKKIVGESNAVSGNIFTKRGPTPQRCENLGARLQLCAELVARSQMWNSCVSRRNQSDSIVLFMLPSSSFT